LKKHFLTSHADAVDKEQIDSLVSISERRVTFSKPKQCPFCNDILDNLKAFDKHVSKHLVEIALFALPGEDEENEDKEEEEGSEEDEDSEGRKRDEGYGENEESEEDEEQFGIAKDGEDDGKNLEDLDQESVSGARLPRDDTGEREAYTEPHQGQPGTGASDEFEWDVNSELDPELALALKMSYELEKEEKAKEESERGKLPQQQPQYSPNYPPPQPAASTILRLRQILETIVGGYQKMA